MKTVFTRSRLLVLFLSVFFASCTNSSPQFEHDITSGATPWTKPLSEEPAQRFTFAIISDLNSGEREGVFEVAAAQLALLKPDFVLSIGDLIDGGTEDTVKLKSQLDSFDQRVAKSNAPFFHLGGNHDLTNVVMRKFWERRYGRRYYHFVYDQVLFLMIDSEDYNEQRMHEIYIARKRAIELLDSGKTELANKSEYFRMQERVSGEISDEQSAYFEKVIKDHPTVRWTFLLMHKPAWKREGNRNLSRIENALTSKNYTVINGHFHEYLYEEQNKKDYIMLGTTGGGQNAEKKNSFDHIMWISFDESPTIANLRLEGILDKKGEIPLGGEKYCFQASKCLEVKK